MMLKIFLQKHNSLVELSQIIVLPLYSIRLRWYFKEWEYVYTE